MVQTWLFLRANIIDVVAVSECSTSSKVRALHRFPPSVPIPSDNPLNEARWRKTFTCKLMVKLSLDHVAAGGNRHPSAADWKPGLLAFGAGKNLALWTVDEDARGGISQLLPGHTHDINATKIYEKHEQRYIITGSADKTIRIWIRDAQAGTYGSTQALTDHNGSINAIAVLEEADLFVSGSADGSLNIWTLVDGTVSLEQTITLTPRYLPLSCALAALDDGSVVLAVAGTSSYIQLYTRPTSSAEFQLQATLTGHEGWIRSLDFVKTGPDGDLLLASASQDKYIRLWRFGKSNLAKPDDMVDPAAAIAKKSLSNKAHQVGHADTKYNVTFEALLVGHEDWIYTVRWAPSTSEDGPRLLSSSADNSLAIWQADTSSGVWICQTRLGEISSQKGSTTATGSTGGFWLGLWQPDGNGVASLGRTGSWRRWQHDGGDDVWKQQTSIGGHSKEVQGLAWAPDGSYLLSTSSDQTTRMWAEWKDEGRRSWQEFARPQIHGYDLNCIVALTPNQFVSGADEKLLRVFNKPRAIDELLNKLCGFKHSTDGELPDAANIPVLGLSNKAITAGPDDEQINGAADEDEREAADPAAVVRKSTLDLEHPPLEDHLARHTLWPEHEKLYGHGYEISAVSASPDGTVVATACKASSIDHAVVRLYEGREWREVRPPLKAHSLTVTAMAFSDDSRWLLSVGRDRQWAVFRRADLEHNTFALFKANPKGHSRMILDCSWAPSEVGVVFATAGRDKTIKLWKVTEDGEVQQVASISAAAAITAVSISPALTSQRNLRLAYGTEDGKLGIADFAADTLQVVAEIGAHSTLAPSAAVNALQWRPKSAEQGVEHDQLAVASDDCSLRIINVKHG